MIKITEDLLQKVKNMFLEDLNKVYKPSKNLRDISMYLIEQSTPEPITSNRFCIQYKEGYFIVGYMFNKKISKVSLILSKKEEGEVKKALYLELGLNEIGDFDALTEEILESKNSREMWQKFDDKLDPLKKLDDLCESTNY